MMLKTFAWAALCTCLGFAACGDDALFGFESWAGIKAHPAVVNPVGRPLESSDVLSLRGEWDFRTTEQPTYGNSPEAKIIFGQGKFWKAEAPSPREGVLRKIRVPGCWEMQGVGLAVTSSPCFVAWDVSPKPMRHCYTGVGWYRKEIKLPAEWKGKRIWLKTGWVNSLARFWVNGEQVAYDKSYCGTYKYEVTDFVTPGSNVMVVVEVMNSVPSRRGGYNDVNHWGGILRDIEFEATPQVLIDDAWVRGDFNGCMAEVKVKIEGQGGGGLTLRATVEGETAEVPISSSVSTYDLHIVLREFRPWSPEHPNLYWAKIELLGDGRVVQTRLERFGVRKLEVRGTDFYLNNKPFFMRGAGWHFVHPVEGAPLADRAIWLDKARKVRSAGFNIVRTHTMCNMPEFYEACDEAGLMVMPELPYYTDICRDGQDFNPLGDARELYEHMRRYPSFAVYSGGNEGWFGPRLTPRLYREIRMRDPDRLMIGQDTWRNRTNNRPGMSDFGGGPMSVWPRGSVRPDDLPFVCHEYLNLCVKLDSRLEPKYTGVYQSPVTRKARAEWLSKFGLDHNWGDRLQDAQHVLQSVWRKYGLESARVDPFCDGYSYWSLQDYASPQKGTYTGQALFDPFWDEKTSGDKASDVAVYNSASCVLLTDGRDSELYPQSDVPFGFKMFVDGVATNRIRCAGEVIHARLHLAHYGERPLSDARVDWWLESADGRALISGNRGIGDQALGAARVVDMVDIVVPAVSAPCRARLVAAVSDSGFSVTNSWNYWIFPKRGQKQLANVACADVFVSALGSRYPGLMTEREWERAKIVVAPYGSELERCALAAGKSVVSLANQTGKADIYLGWWWMGDQMGAAMRESRLLRHLPQEGFFNPLFFRIGKTGLKLPVSGVSADDLVMVGEGAEACFLYLADVPSPTGAHRMIVAGLDVLSDTPEGAALLDGVLEAAGDESRCGAATEDRRPVLQMSESEAVSWRK